MPGNRDIDCTVATAQDNHGRPQAPPRAMTQAEEDLWELNFTLMGSLARDRHMSQWDVVCLNINSMIGNGIFTTPGVVLALTRSKAIALTFWFVGGVYALLG